jgi:hypothetical protein
LAVTQQWWPLWATKAQSRGAAVQSGNAYEGKALGAVPKKGPGCEQTVVKVVEMVREATDGRVTDTAGAGTAAMADGTSGLVDRRLPVLRQLQFLLSGLLSLVPK